MSCFFVVDLQRHLFTDQRARNLLDCHGISRLEVDPNVPGIRVPLIGVGVELEGKDVVAGVVWPEDSEVSAGEVGGDFGADGGDEEGDVVGEDVVAVGVIRCDDEFDGGFKGGLLALSPEGDQTIEDYLADAVTNQ
ncbi:hypothetical protein C2S53_014039 [Perilla frutescens var. hirtella]|uniref:Uncharacterized protein n=1 Tax=Perilla frutescens var. hirtella TaxID=608512 RepID=A0AAD4NZ34_PERFH|nr:hypothetical protein C2S53_014039 [Perilla frutescens var. hirtella]